MRRNFVVCIENHQVRLGLPVQRQVEIARKDLPSRAVIELDDVALQVRAYLHDSNGMRLLWGAFDGRGAS
ncbi:sRNA-binding carbon storage regulator CsrA [Bradyrhizobium sp. USDA 4518]